MNRAILRAEDVLHGYDKVSSLYPYIPSLSHWRAWEYAAYQKYLLNGRILDLGCGDGRYFRLIWPHVTDVVGVEKDPSVAKLSRLSGVYQRVHDAEAHEVPEMNESFDHVFANCSLEHMDHLDEVLSEVFRCLKPGGSLLCSVVTDRFIQWSMLPNLITIAGFSDAAASLQEDFLSFHHLANPLSVEKWQQHFIHAGLVPEEHVPILPRFNSSLFLFMESIWHIKRTGGGEMGDCIFPFLASNSNYPTAFRTVVVGLLEMETDWEDCSGAVFLNRKPA